MGNLLVQPTLAGGELDPGLHGRVDLGRYGTSLATCRNWWVLPSGGMVNRTGSKYVASVKTMAKRTRIIPFIVAEDVAYVIEIGEGYMRFFFMGAPVMSEGEPVEVVAPWQEDEIFDVAYTQSVDVMTLTHPAHPTQDLRRLSDTSFELVERDFTDGPFAPMNADESKKIASSSATGTTTLTANFNLFTADMVGSLVYLEQKELRSVKPWTPDERNITVGQIRRSDGKYYRVASVPSITGLAGTPYLLTGNVRPTHDFGRAFDGPQDTRTDGTNEYKVGVEWEYLHGGFGIVKITGYTSATAVTGVVTRRLPDSVVGGLAAPATTWTISGVAATLTYAIAGATSVSVRDYAVTIGGVGVAPNPFQVPPNTGGQVPPGAFNVLEPLP